MDRAPWCPYVFYLSVEPAALSCSTEYSRACSAVSLHPLLFRDTFVAAPNILDRAPWCPYVFYLSVEPAALSCSTVYSPACSAVSLHLLLLGVTFVAAPSILERAPWCPYVFYLSVEPEPAALRCITVYSPACSVVTMWNFLWGTCENETRLKPARPIAPLWGGGPPSRCPPSEASPHSTQYQSKDPAPHCKPDPSSAFRSSWAVPCQTIVSGWTGGDTRRIFLHCVGGGS